MITKNTAGQALSANYGTTVASDNRDWQMKLYANGTELSCAIAGLEITKGSCGSGEGFSIGNVVSSMLTCDLLECNTDIKGADIRVDIGLDTGTMEWITIGHFIAVEVIKTTYTTSVTGYGFSTAKTGGSFTIPSTLSLANIASAISTATGCTITFDSGINTSLVIRGALTAGMSCYEGLQVLAHTVGGYATDTNDGNIAIHKYSSTATLSVDTGRMVELPQLEESAFDITGVKVLVQEADPDAEPPLPEISYTYGTPVVLFDENEYMTSALFDVYKGIVGYEYYTGTIDLTLGDPRIEGNDVLNVTDAEGNTYIVPCHSVKHSYDGGLATTVEAVKATADADGIFSIAPVTQRIDEISTATAIAQASANQAQISAQEAQESAEQAQASAEQAQQMVSDLEDEVDALDTRVDTAEGKITTIEGDIDTIEGNVSTLQGRVTNAEEDVNETLHALGVAEAVIDTINWITEHGTMTLTTDTQVDPNKVYFAVDPNGIYVVGSTHYSIVENPVDSGLSTYYELTTDSAISNYIESHIALTSAGLVVTKDNTKWYVLVKNDGIDIVDNTTGLHKVVASYGASVVIGQNASGYSRTEIGTSGMQIVQKNSNGNDVQIANLGYGLGNAQSGTAIAPYYTFGTRNQPASEYSSVSTYVVGDMCIYDGKKYVCIKPIDIPTAWDSSDWQYLVGNYSHAEGQLTIASGSCSHAEGRDTTTVGYASHAEGWSTTASGTCSHAEGLQTTARGSCSHAEGGDTIAGDSYSHAEGFRTTAGYASHAEGRSTTANGTCSHAEGLQTTARGSYSHSQNSFTIAQRKSQTAIGEYNKADTTGSSGLDRGSYVFIIGNGTADDARSNALTVAWDGNVEMALDTSASSGTDHDIYAALVALGWDSDVIV